MNIKKKYWIIMTALLIPHFAYSLTLFDALLGYFLGTHSFIFSYPSALMLYLVGNIFGETEGFTGVFYLVYVIYPLYSLLVFIVSIVLTRRLNRIEEKKYPKFIIITIIVLLLPLLVTIINARLSTASYDKENRELLESQNDLTVNTYKAEFKNDEIIIPITIEGLKPGNETYLIEVTLGDKELGNFGHVSFEAKYLDNKWEYSSVLDFVDNVKQDNENILLTFIIDDSNRYERERLEIIVDIHLDFNLFYSERIDVIVQ